MLLLLLLLFVWSLLPLLLLSVCLSFLGLD